MIPCQKLELSISNYRSKSTDNFWQIPDRSNFVKVVFGQEKLWCYNNNINGFGISYSHPKWLIKQIGLEYQNLEIGNIGPRLDRLQDSYFWRVKVHKINLKLVLLSTKNKHVNYFAGITLGHFFGLKYSEKQSISKHYGLYASKPDSIKIDAALPINLEFDFGIKFNLLEINKKPLIFSTYANLWVQDNLLVGVAWPSKIGYAGHQLMSYCKSICFSFSYPIYNKIK